jgi:hypothetical protein
MVDEQLGCLDTLQAVAGHPELSVAARAAIVLCQVATAAADAADGAGSDAGSNPAASGSGASGGSGAAVDETGAAEWTALVAHEALATALTRCLTTSRPPSAGCAMDESLGDQPPSGASLLPPLPTPQCAAAGMGMAEELVVRLLECPAELVIAAPRFATELAVELVGLLDGLREG